MAEVVQDSGPEAEEIDWDAVIGGGKASKGRTARNQKHKQKQRERRAAAAATTESVKASTLSDQPVNSAPISVDVEYEMPDPEQTAAALGPEFSDLADVFKNFGGRAAAAASEEDFPVSSGEAHAEDEGGGELGEDDAALGGEDAEPVMSRRARKKLLQYSVADLKQSVAHPEVVEAHDVSAANPMLLVYLKAYRNTVPVPRHWCHKRKYLQGKRGFEKPPFQLPEYIAATGISKMRGLDLEKADAQSLKGKQR